MHRTPTLNWQNPVSEFKVTSKLKIVKIASEDPVAEYARWNLFGPLQQLLHDSRSETRSSRTSTPGSIWAKSPPVVKIVPTWQPLVLSTAVTADWASSRASGQHEWEAPNTALCVISTVHLFILKEQQPPPLTFAPAIGTATTIFREALCIRHVSKQINKWEWVMHLCLTEWHMWQLHSGSAWRNRLRE